MSVLTEVRVALTKDMTCLEAKGAAYLNFTPRFTADFVREILEDLQKQTPTVPIYREDGSKVDVPWSMPVRDALDLDDDAKYVTVQINVLESDLADRKETAGDGGGSGQNEIDLSKKLGAGTPEGMLGGPEGDDGDDGAPRFRSFPRSFKVTRLMSNLEFSNLVDMELGLTLEEAQRDNADPANRVQPTDFEVDQEALDKGRVIVLIIDHRRPIMDDEVVQDAEDFIDGLSEVELSRLNELADDLFWEQSGYNPGQALKKGDPNFDVMAESWLEFRRELATTQKHMALLPDRIKNFLHFDENGVPLNDQNIRKVIELADKLGDLSDAELAGFWERTNGKAKSVDGFVNSVELYLEKLKQRNAATEARQDAERALYGKDELYAVWDLANESPKQETYHHGGDIFTNEQHVEFNIRRKQAIADLPGLLEKYGYANVEEFEAEVKAYETSFREEATAIAQDSLDKRDHEIFEFRDEHATPAATGGMFDSLAEAREAYRARMMQYGDAGLDEDMAPFIEAAERKDPHLAALLDFFRKEDPKGNVPFEVVELLVKEDSIEDFREELEEMLDDRKEAIGEMREDLQDEDSIWSLDVALAEARLRAGVDNDGLMFDDILDEAKEDATKWDFVGELALGVAAIVAGLVSGGTGTVAVLGAAAALGLGAYGAWDTVNEYNEEEAAYLSGLASSRPSIIWVVISLATLPLDVLGLGSAIKAAGKGAGAVADLGKAAHIAAILDEGHDVGKAVRAFDDASGSVKTAEDATREVKKLEQALEAADTHPSIRKVIVEGAKDQLEEVVAFAKVVPEPIDIVGTSVAQIASKLEFSVFRQNARRGGDFAQFMESPAAKTLLGSADDLKADSKALAKVKDAYEAASEKADALVARARDMEMTDLDLDGVVNYWSRNPGLSPEEIEAALPAFREARKMTEGFDDLSEETVDAVRKAYQENLAQAERIATIARRAALDDDELKLLLDIHGATGRDVGDIIDDIIRTRPADAPAPISGRPGALREEGVVSSQGAVHVPPGTSGKGRSIEVPDEVMSPETKALLREHADGRSGVDEFAGSGGIEKIEARTAPGDDTVLEVEIEGELLPKRLERDSGKTLQDGQSQAPNYNDRRNKKQPAMKDLGLETPEDWQRLHLWGPGFGDEAGAGMFLGPRVVNNEWQSAGIEEMIRELGRQVAPHRPGFKLKCKATARCWSKPTPKGFTSSSGEAFLKEARYDIIIELPDGTTKTARIDITIGADPADINAGLDPAVHIGFQETQFRELFDALPLPPE